MCLALVPAEDVVALPSGTSWWVPWELLMLGPFVSCVLANGDEMRHVTAAAMVRSAVKRSTQPEEPLHAEDYEMLRVFAPETTLVEAARLVVETGWEVAIVNDTEARMITSRTVFRALLQSELRDDSDAVVGRGPAPTRASTNAFCCKH